jgi:hypothetical protein
MYPRSRDHQPPHPMAESLRAEFDASASQFEQNKYMATRRDGKYTEGDHYLGVVITTARATVTGRIFDIYGDGSALEVVTGEGTIRHLIDSTDIVIVNIAAVETIKITESFKGTFEVAIPRESLTTLLNDIQLQKGLLDAIPSDDLPNADGEAFFGAMEQCRATLIDGIQESNIDIAQRHWFDFTLREANIHGRDRLHPAPDFYTSRVEADTEGAHLGEVTFRHTFDGMPSDYLYADTRLDVQDAYIEALLDTPVTAPVAD